jgi:hypothetical protein
MICTEEDSYFIDINTILSTPYPDEGIPCELTPVTDMSSVSNNSDSWSINFNDTSPWTSSHPVKNDDSLGQFLKRKEREEEEVELKMPKLDCGNDKENTELNLMAKPKIKKQRIDKPIITVKEITELLETRLYIDVTETYRFKVETSIQLLLQSGKKQHMVFIIKKQEEFKQLLDDTDLHFCPDRFACKLPIESIVCLFEFFCTRESIFSDHIMKAATAPYDKARNKKGFEVIEYLSHRHKVNPADVILLLQQLQNIATQGRRSVMILSIPCFHELNKLQYTPKSYMCFIGIMPDMTKLLGPSQFLYRAHTLAMSDDFYLYESYFSSEHTKIIVLANAGKSLYEKKIVNGIYNTLIPPPEVNCVMDMLGLAFTDVSTQWATDVYGLAICTDIPSGIFKAIYRWLHKHWTTARIEAGLKETYFPELHLPSLEIRFPTEGHLIKFVFNERHSRRLKVTLTDNDISSRFYMPKGESKMFKFNDVIPETRCNKNGHLEYKHKYSRQEKEGIEAIKLRDIFTYY